MAFRADDISINTLVGNGSFIQGNLKVNGFIRIDGDIDGDIETDGAVIISERARLRGNLTAKSAIIGGIVLGNISAREGVKLLSSSAVIGNIITRKVQMEDKVIFHGYCISLDDEQKFEEQSRKFLQAKAIRDKAVLS
ncbi:MAG: polymer-forming cytoskeletal protein [Treponema sp.]|jgi:cytoskeletal protein CcmA (bactofilin family)|nr:polymer-forming cytoskeletal protein [Treponema sp.]